MAKPIKQNPVLQGKAARQFDQMFLSNSKPDPEKIERHRRDVEVFRRTRQIAEQVEELVKNTPPEVIERMTRRLEERRRQYGSDVVSERRADPELFKG